MTTSSRSIEPLNQSFDINSLDEDQYDEQTEFTMSIGRIFHKLKLDGDTITITQYRPRHPYPTIKIDYCYRFRAPFHETYDQSWVHFKSEKLENYSWNYLDNYICARGDNFELRNSLKFWRLRIIVMPSRLNLRKIQHSSEDCSINNDANNRTKTTCDNKICTRHDVHHLHYSAEERVSLMESFIRLLEIINKTRRASTGRLSTSSVTAALSSSLNINENQSFCLNSNLESTGRLNVILSNQTRALGSTSSSSDYNFTQPSRAAQSKKAQSEDKKQDNNNKQTDNDNATGDDQNDKKAQGAPVAKNHTAQPDPPHNDEKEDDGDNANDQGDQKVEQKLHFESINMDIDSSLRSHERAEWVHVHYHNYYDVDQAYEFVIKWMVASGAGIAEMVQSWSRKVGNSSVHVVPIPWEPFALPHTGKADPLRCPLVMRLNLDALPDGAGRAMGDNHVLKFQEKILRRFGFITFRDLISTEKLDRQFIHLSGFAFVALPNLVNDDDAGEDDDDGNDNADREISDMSYGSNNTLINCDDIRAAPSGPGESSLARKHEHQSLTNTRPANATANQQQDGLTKAVKPISISGTNSTTAGATDGEETKSVLKNMRSPREQYITRHIGGARQNRTSRMRGEINEIEFIWSWNYMLTKRWRSSATQDESYAVSLMQDFKAFCMNHSNRLVSFWYTIKDEL